MEKHVIDQYAHKNQKLLRYGVTTGSCATAAACAASMRLLLGKDVQSVSVKTPKLAVLDIPVFCSEYGEDYAEYYVIKDSGDDPDVTDGAGVYVRVSIVEESDTNCFADEDFADIYLDGGVGIGRVTKEGLEQRVGQAAINAVPRRMIFEAVHNVKDEAAYEGKLLVVVSMPEGKKLAEKTFNSMLGIEGGLSILGTSGIIEPMSERAIIDTIESRIRQKSNIGETKLLVTPGNYGQGYVSDYLKLPLSDGIKCSNYIGETLDLAVSYGIKTLLLVGNIGKLVKLAAGIMNTHSKVADGRGEIFGVHAAMCGASAELVKEIMHCINTDSMLELLAHEGLKEMVLNRIICSIEEKVKYRVGDAMSFSVVLFSEKYGYLGATAGAEEIIRQFR